MEKNSIDGEQKGKSTKRITKTKEEKRGPKPKMENTKKQEKK